MQHVRDNIIKDYMGFMPVPQLVRKHGTEVSDILLIVGDGNRQKRAQALMDKLPRVDNTLPQVVRIAILKLGVISLIGDKFASNHIEDLRRIETIHNYALKAQIADYALWKNTDVEEDSILDMQWVITISESEDLKELEAYARVLRDKITLKEEARNVTKYYHNWDAHVERCVRLGLDSKQYSEEDAIQVEDIYENLKEEAEQLGKDN